jgi:arginyl-tRNA synthetase
MNLKHLLNQRWRPRCRSLGEPAPAVVQPAARPEFGDYQANGVMGAAKRSG